MPVCVDFENVEVSPGLGGGDARMYVDVESVQRSPNMGGGRMCVYM